MKSLYAKLFIFSISILFFSQFIRSQTMPMKDKFYIGYHSNFYSPWNWGTVFPRFSQLNINFMQNYGFHFDRQNVGIDGGFFDDISSYSGNVNSLLGNWNATFPGSNALFMEREKVLRAAYGQLSDYQCENVPSTTHPGYGYITRNGSDYTETWQGDSVSGIYTGLPDINNPTGHWLVDSLYENMEQINFPAPKQPVGIDISWDSKYYYSDIKTPFYKWFVLPRMRIDSADAFGPSKPVCRIVVVPYDGDTTTDSTRKVDIFTSDFRDANGNYNGQYLENYYRLGSLLPMSIFGSQLNRGNGPISDMDARSYDPYASKVDYRIYWYGQVDVHLDRVRVADEWAFYLFHPELDALIMYMYNFAERIKKAAEDGLQYFCPVVYERNQQPCINELNRLLLKYSKNAIAVNKK